jgi:ribosomal protein L32
MLDRTVKRALERIGGRAQVLDRCPVCGESITTAHERVRAWPGKYAHARCASYARRTHRRYHDRGTGGE